MFHNFSKIVDFPVLREGSRQGYLKRIALFIMVNVSVIENIYICIFNKTKINIRINGHVEI
jgi:hypothetical protein